MRLGLAAWTHAMALLPLAGDEYGHRALALLGGVEGFADARQARRLVEQIVRHTPGVQDRLQVDARGIGHLGAVGVPAAVADERHQRQVEADSLAPQRVARLEEPGVLDQ